MKRLTLSLVTLLIAALAAAADRNAEILGTWHGTSICTDRQIAPACKDEEVVYDFRATDPPKSDHAWLKADKIVNGERVTMGEMEFEYDAASHRWLSEFRTPRVHGRWSFAIDGAKLTGTLIDLPTGAVVRKVDTTREKK